MRILFSSACKHCLNIWLCGETGSAYRCTKFCLVGCGRSPRYGIHTTMARKKKKTGSLAKDIISPEGLPEDYSVVGSAIWWEANPDKSKKYRRKNFKGKKFLTFKQAEIFLEISGPWLGYFTRGEKGFPVLPFSWDGSNPATIKFSREDLVKYWGVLQERQFNIKTRPQRK